MQLDFSSVAYLDTLKVMMAYLGPERSFQSNLEFFLQILSKNHGFLRAHLVLFEPETGLLRLRLANTPQETNEATYSPGVGVTGQVFTTGKSVIVEKMKDDSQFMSLLFTRTQEEMENLAFISVPVLAPLGSNPMNSQDVLGVLNVDSPSQDPKILKEQCLFLELVASLIASGVAYLQDELSRLCRFDVATSRSEKESDLFFSFSKVMRHIVDQANYLAQGRTPILIYGETGVGKEQLARRIHAAGARKDMPFVICHCTALPEEKMLSELFGYQKGAFVGASQTQKGLFEQAQDGTILINNVEVLTEEAQEALLAVLQEHEIRRVGLETPIACDVRVIVASAVSLESLVQEGIFSKELFARLNTCTLQIPALRDRREEIIPLAEQILQNLASNSKDNALEDGISPRNKKMATSAVKRISYPALKLLTQYYWPGNVLELKKCMELAAKNCDDKVIRSRDLPPSLQTAESSATTNTLPFGEAVLRFEKELLTDALIRTHGNVLRASSLLQSSYRIVNYKVKKYNIDPKQFVTRKRS